MFKNLSTLCLKIYWRYAWKFNNLIIKNVILQLHKRIWVETQPTCLISRFSRLDSQSEKSKYSRTSMHHRPRCTQFYDLYQLFYDVSAFQRRKNYLIRSSIDVVIWLWNIESLKKAKVFRPWQNSKLLSKNLDQ